MKSHTNSVEGRYMLMLQEIRIESILTVEVDTETASQAPTFRRHRYGNDILGTINRNEGNCSTKGVMETPKV